MNTVTLYRILISWFVLASLSACSTPADQIKIHDIKELDVIYQTYQSTVRTAHGDSRHSWNNGRLGNIIVNINGEPNLGLCYHWQKLVYIGIQPALEKTGWKAVGIAINEGSFFEHHAVLIYDPNRLSLKDILKESKKSDSYVLDPWSSGEPRIYTVGNWITLPVTIKTQARLTEVATSPP